jgi:alpha-D-ribose 1-methylphosphonate 5-triphosphate synthase subunit PhnH
LDCFRVGPSEYPDKATTIVVQVDDILPAAVNKYPNILFDNTVQLDLKGVPNKFWNQWWQLSGLYPLGVDIFFTCDDVLIALSKIKRNMS